ncbi:heat shock 70 kDa protein 12A-like isoform X2 [Adelges cooleyi]|uniref:heat shock 70 kDa protein 12A-like isoform X2 n=1 Tax=Adelges cooleyi TaxID=133065 RepID=UPI00217FE1E2|nr:heat shock 70 kDa protein 12A-like isoform X2 [Adelges cooleyi]
MFTNSKKSEFAYAIEPEAAVYQIHDRREPPAMNIDTYHERRRGRVFVDDPLSSLEQEILLFRHNNIQKFQQGCVEEEPEYQLDDIECALRYNSLDSGIPHEYEEDEVANSINTTLNRLISLSLEQQCFQQENEGEMTSFRALPVKTNGCCSPQILNEAYNLVEEVYVNRDQCHTELHALDESPEDGIIVAVDLGTTYSGYAYSFKRSGRIKMMKKPDYECETINDGQKIPTALLLTPNLNFHSFGTAARDYYHDMHPEESQKWYYFDKFKMFLYNKDIISKETHIMASNNIPLPATRVLVEALRHLRLLIFDELSSRCSEAINPDSITWVLTIPAIWTKNTRKLIKDIAIEAGMGNSENLHSVCIILEPEAAAVYCRNIRLKNTKILSTNWLVDAYETDYCVLNEVNEGCSYMVVDCGGGTVDITVHQVFRTINRLPISKLQKPSAGVCGSLSVDIEFVKLLCALFGFGFMSDFKLQRPAAYMELLQRFEEVKKTVSSKVRAPIVIRPPYAFIEHYMKYSEKDVSDAVKDYGCDAIQWNELDGVFVLDYLAVEPLFLPSFACISEQISVIANDDQKVTHMFLVGGYAQSLWLQEKIVERFSDRIKIILPDQAAVSVLQGAVMCELNRSDIPAYRAKHSYAVGIIKPFIDDTHPIEKLVVKDGKRWCTDLLDYLIEENDIIRDNETIIKRYTPANPLEGSIVINIYLVQNNLAKFVTDSGVSKCGSLKLSRDENIQLSKELLVQMGFGGQGEVVATALDLSNGTRVDAQISETDC